ncbi:Rad52 22 double-strand break repair protein [Fusarium globosum]|uniref:Rad52 22 double-strand break repair protein n=1 Tax=Fusarium globosum TaxID=78864 RepID=A0A8H5XNK5_9HYPO|nr:Rad52 22 double-strand break repair protein [Fusarium globosum]
MTESLALSKAGVVEATEESTLKRSWSDATLLSVPDLEDEGRHRVKILRKDLQRPLGPELVSHRKGPGGSSVPYVSGGTAVWLANHFFGNDGWSDEIVKEDLDVVRDDDARKWVAHSWMTVKVTVYWKGDSIPKSRYGKGYGGNKPYRTKGEAIEAAIKEAETDAFKRAIRKFGDVLGNCLYREETRKFIERVRAREGKRDLTKQYNAEDMFRLMLDKEQTGAAAPIVEAKPRPVVGIPVKTVDENTEEYDDDFGSDLEF